MTGRRVDVVRSPADVLRLVVATSCLVLLLLVEALFGATVAGFLSDLLRGLDAIGERFLTTVVVLVRLAAVVVLALAATAAVARGRSRAAATIAAASAAAIGLLAISDAVVTAKREALVHLSDVVSPLSTGGFPTSAGLAVTAAALTASAPWLTRSYRRLGWTLALGLTVATFVATPVSGIALAALLGGWTGGALAVVAFGAPARSPTEADVAGGLRTVGVDVAGLEPASVDARGSTPYFGTTVRGEPLFVKVLGRDERDADLLFRLYRSVSPRDLGDERPSSSLRRAVEHEALLAMSATDFGIRTPRVAGFSDAGSGAFALAYDGLAGRSLDRVPAGDVSDAVLDGLWRQVVVLRAHRVAHRDLRLANVFLDAGGNVWLIDFGFAELAASEVLLATDLAEVLTALATKVGAARAVATGRAVLGGGPLRTALPRLRPALLSRATRSKLKANRGLLDELLRVLDAPEPGRTGTGPTSRVIPSG